MKNNIAFPNKTAYIGGEYASGEYNTWNLNLDLSASDFLSVDDPSMTITGKDISAMAGALGPRKADGSLPDVEFLKLKAGSRAIDKGVNVGLPYTGKAPDLGAYEYGLVSSSSVESSSSVAESSNSVIESSSSIGETSSSANATTSVFVNRGNSVETTSAKVFDMQGRYLGTLPIESLQGGTLAEILWMKLKKPGVYMVKQGRNLQTVKIK
jgi:hypothetical protein